MSTTKSRKVEHKKKLWGPKKNMTKNTIKGRLILKEIEFNQVYPRTVHKCNDRAGKVTLPLELLGSKVFVVVEKKK